MTIHDGHPFDDGTRDPARQFRGRLGGAVTLWTAGTGSGRAGLTVSSVLVALGEPARVLGLLDPDSDLAAVLTDTGRAVVALLGWPHRGLADMFAGVAPAPGGPFRHAPFVETPWGPRLETADTWAGVVLESATDVGWSRLVTAMLELVTVGPDAAPLVARRGRWVRPG